MEGVGKVLVLEWVQLGVALQGSVLPDVAREQTSPLVAPIYIYIFISKSAIHYIITVDHKSWITWAPFKGLFFIFFLCLYLDLITLIVLTCLCMLLWNRSS